MFDLTLSFDNGPEPEVTPAALDILRERGIATTFFVLGRKLATPEGRALAARAHAEGHWIGNHTWNHGPPLNERLDDEAPELEIGATQAELGALSHPDRLFRPNGRGALNQPLSRGAADYLAAGGYTCVLWNAVPRDWDDDDGWVARALAQCLSQPWTALVLHDLSLGAVRNLPRFLDAVELLGGRIRQDFPLDCTPMIRGKASPALEQYVSA